MRRLFEHLVVYTLVGLVTATVFHEAGHVVGAWLSGASVVGVGYNSMGFYVLVEPATTLSTLMGLLSGSLCTVYLLWDEHIDNIATVVASSTTLYYIVFSIVTGQGDAALLWGGGAWWGILLCVFICIVVIGLGLLEIYNGMMYDC